MVKRLCINCKKDISSRNLRTKYCSSKCRSSYNNSSYNNLRYELFLKRDEILKIKGNKCYFCGKNYNLNVHHINYKSNNLSNLYLLCSSCHNKLHAIINKSL